MNNDPSLDDIKCNKEVLRGTQYYNLNNNAVRQHIIKKIEKELLVGHEVEQIHYVRIKKPLPLMAHRYESTGQGSTCVIPLTPNITFRWLVFDYKTRHKDSYLRNENIQELHSLSEQKKLDNTERFDLTHTYRQDQKNHAANGAPVNCVFDNQLGSTLCIDQRHMICTENFERGVRADFIMVQTSSIDLY